MGKRMFYINLVLLLMVLFVDQAFCGITDAQIKAASKTFISTMKDWMPAIIGGGLIGSGICLFANNFKMGIAGLAGTGFPDKKLVRVEGKLNNYVGSKRIKDSQETYEVTFRTYRGRLYFKEIKHLGEEK